MCARVTEPTHGYIVFICQLHCTEEEKKRKEV